MTAIWQSLTPAVKGYGARTSAAAAMRTHAQYVWHLQEHRSIYVATQQVQTFQLPLMPMIKSRMAVISILQKSIMMQQRFSIAPSMAAMGMRADWLPCFRIGTAASWHSILKQATSTSPLAQRAIAVSIQHAFATAPAHRLHMATLMSSLQNLQIHAAEMMIRLSRMKQKQNLR